MIRDTNKHNNSTELIMASQPIRYNDGRMAGWPDGRMAGWPDGRHLRPGARVRS